MSLPLRLRRLERTAGAPRDPGLLALLDLRIRPLLRCRRRWHLPAGDALDAAVAAAGALGRRRRPVLARGLTVSPTAAAAPNGQRPQCRSARTGCGLATSGRAALRAAPPVLPAAFATQVL